MIISDLETFNTNRSVPYSVSKYKQRNISSKYNRDKLQRELEKCRNDCGVFKRTNCMNKMLDHVLGFKGELKKYNDKNVKQNL